MANIYLRVPQYVAAFYRHRDEDHPLDEWTPIVFGDYTYENRLIRQGICLDSSQKYLSTTCYSAASWKNICKGKLPRGGKLIFIRDEKQWPNSKEIVTLEGRALKLNEGKFDYLCIALPREAIVGGMVIRTNANCTLSSKKAVELCKVLRDEFYHHFYEWCLNEERMFRQKGIAIHKTEMMERFYARYDIPMNWGNSTENTMRQMAKRLFWRGKNATVRRNEQQGDYFDYVSDEMRKKQEQKKT